MSGWLDLAQLGLAPNQKHQALLGAPKSVHCGLPQDSFEARVPLVPNYCAREIWKKLSISVIGVKRKLSAVGLPVTRQPPHRSRRAVFPHRALREYSLPQQD